MSDVSFYPTELPQYALLESFLGLHMQTAHVAAAMTYTLTFLLAVLLARSGSRRPRGLDQDADRRRASCWPRSSASASSPSTFPSGTSAPRSRCC